MSLQLPLEPTTHVDRVTGDGVPMTTAQRVAKYGARTRPTVTAGVPMFEMDGALDAKYREAALIRYEDFDIAAAKVLRDYRAWLWFLIIAATIIPATGLLFTLGVFPAAVAVWWTIPAAVAIAAGIPYRRLERKKHALIVEDARAYVQTFVNSGKARFVDGQ